MSQCKWASSHVTLRHFWERAWVTPYERVMSHIWMSHVTHMNESCHTYGWVMSHIWMSHVTHRNVSCHTYECVMCNKRPSLRYSLHLLHSNCQLSSHVTRMNESCLTKGVWYAIPCVFSTIGVSYRVVAHYERVKSRIWMRNVKRRALCMPFPASAAQ